VKGWVARARGSSPSPGHAAVAATGEYMPIAFDKGTFFNDLVEMDSITRIH